MSSDAKKRFDKNSIRHILNTVGPLLALLVVCVGFYIADRIWGAGNFASVRNLRFLLATTAPVAVAALGMTLLIIAGGIDLSAGTASTLCATVLVCAVNAEWWFSCALLLTLLTGAVCGLTNGLLIGLLRIPPFIVTLGSMTVFLGIGKLLSNSSTVMANLERLPSWLVAMSSTKAPNVYYQWIPNIATGVWLALVVSAIVAAILRWSVFGRHLFAIGSNEATARLCGVNILGTKLAVYALAGVLFSLAGIYYVSLIKQANPTDGVGKELRFIAAVVIGGGSLSGGRGTVLGTLTGAAIMVVITNGCMQIGVGNAVQDIIFGSIVVAAVTLDQLRVARAKT